MYFEKQAWFALALHTFAVDAQKCIYILKPNSDSKEAQDFQSEAV